MLSLEYYTQLSAHNIIGLLYIICNCRYILGKGSLSMGSSYFGVLAIKSLKTLALSNCVFSTNTIFALLKKYFSKFSAGLHR